jgi:hypothetical protein
MTLWDVYTYYLQIHNFLTYVLQFKTYQTLKFMLCTESIHMFSFPTFHSPLLIGVVDNQNLFYIVKMIYVHFTG